MTRSQPTPWNHQREGFTIVEVLVVIAVIGLLISLILPAVQATREVARSTGCMTHLKQLVLASQNYHESMGYFPTRLKPFQLLLPFIEQQALADAIPLGTATSDSFNLSLYMCPSAPREAPTPGHPHYLLNEGAGFQKFGAPAGFNGITSSPYGLQVFTRSSDIRDGMSSTAMFSERKVTPVVPSAQDAAVNPNQYLWYIPAPLMAPTQYDAFRQSCLTQRTVAMPPVYPTGYGYLQADWGYNHVVPPNRPGCYNAANQAQVLTWDMGLLAISATSYHRNYVHVAFADGAVRRVANEIDLAVWHALGTRNGNEVIAGTF